MRRTGEAYVTATERVERALARIERREPEVHAWQVVAAEPALARAAALDEGEGAGPLHGVPVGVKDVFDTGDLVTEYGSPIYRGHRPGTDAAVVAKLREAGAVVLGKTVTTEFACYHPGPTRNPRDLRRTPGGSSSGSAAAVADGMVPLALGTQTAGSTIRPAAFCGIASMATSVGGLSVAGVHPVSPSLDTVGLFAGSMPDLAAFYQALAGPGEQLEVPRPDGLTLLWSDGAGWAELDPEMAEVFERLRTLLAEQGVRLVELGRDVDCAELARDHLTIMTREASRVHAEHLRTAADQLSVELTELLEHGRSVDETEYHDATARVATRRAAFAERLAGVDALLLPAALGPAPEGLDATGDPALSRPWQVMGLPAIALPGLTSTDGLPLGMQLVGPQAGDRALLSTALALEPLLLPPRPPSPA